MPDRILRASILSSDRVNAVSFQAEVFYRRLMSLADDYGRYDGRLSILRAHLYALKLDRVTESDVGKWIDECREAGLVRVYSVEGKPYLEVPRFGQRTRAQNSKWPPPSSADIRGHPPADVGDPRSSAAVFVVGDGCGGAAGAGAREEGRTLPQSLDTPAFREAWGDWLQHWSEAFGRSRVMPLQTADAQLRKLVKIGPDRAIEAIRNAITKGNLREPAEPFGSPASNRPDPALKMV